ncbi:hypothetical protein COE41_29750, partial [Bacillus thuringiensis]
RELATEQHVLVVAGDGPRALRLAGERPGVDLGVPVQELRARLARVVRVAVDVGGVHAARVLRRGGGAVEGPGLGLREAAGVAAVVLVAGRVH